MCCIGVCGTSEQVHIGSVKLDNNRECELKLWKKKRLWLGGWYGLRAEWNMKRVLCQTIGISCVKSCMWV